MYYFFYGENAFQIKSKIEALRNRFLSSSGSEFDIFEYDGESLSKEVFDGVVFSLPFLAEKRLIIINNCFRNTNTNFKKYVAENLKKIPDTAVVVFVEYGLPDRRETLFKKLAQPKISQNFEAYIGEKLENWIKKRIEDSGIKISSEVCSKLILYAGNDLWRLDNEIKKLSLYKKTKLSDDKINVTLEDIEKNVTAEANSNIFSYVESLASKTTKNAFIALNNLINSGENELKILVMIVYQYRVMLIINDLLSKNLSLNEIGKRSKIHPFVIKKNMMIIKRYDYSRLVSIYLNLADIDQGIKKGAIDPKLALDLLTAKLCV